METSGYIFRVHDTADPSDHFVCACIFQMVISLRTGEKYVVKAKTAEQSTAWFGAINTQINVAEETGPKKDANDGGGDPNSAVDTDQAMTLNGTAGDSPQRRLGRSSELFLVVALPRHQREQQRARHGGWRHQAARGDAHLSKRPDERAVRQSPSEAFALHG